MEHDQIFQRHPYEKYWDYQKYRIIDCQSCGFKHIFPAPTIAEVEEYYREHYFKAVKPYPYHIADDEYVGRVKENIANNRDFNDIFNKVAEIKETAIETMLDIGCGNNLLAFFFARKGWKTTIVEPSKDAGNYLRKFGLTVHNQPIEAVEKLEIDALSFINMQFVLEHLRDPGAVLSQLAALMIPGGIIRVCVPNDFSEGQLAYLDTYAGDPGWVSLPDHINYFTFDSLKGLLAKAGFTEVYRTTNYPLEFLLLAGMNYYASEDARKQVGPFIKNFEAAFRNTGRTILLKRYYENLAQLGMGRSIFMYAIKG